MASSPKVIAPRLGTNVYTVFMSVVLLQLLCPTYCTFKVFVSCMHRFTRSQGPDSNQNVHIKMDNHSLTLN